MVLKLLLACALVSLSHFVVNVDAQLTCGAYPCVPGLENLGRGFDCVFGTVKEANVVDLMTSSSTTTYTNPYHGTVYGIPAATSIANTPEYDIESVTFRSSVSYATTRAYDFGLVFDKQWEKSLFSLNLEVDHIRETLSAGDVVVSLTREIQNVYTAQLAPFDQLHVTSQFQSDVNNLPSKYDSAAYQSFINTYGTHAVQWGVFGGEAAMLSVVENSVTEVYSDLTVSLSLKLLYLQLKGSLEVAYNKDGMSTDVQTNIRYYNLTFVGGNEAIGSSNFTAWINSVRYSPTFVRASVVNITQFVDDATKKANLMFQIEQYIAANEQDDVAVPEVPLRLSWCNATTEANLLTCQNDPPKVVIGTQVNNGYSEMPYDCAAPCVSWNAAAAFDVHDWNPSTAYTRPLHSFPHSPSSSSSSTSSSSSSSTCMAASYKCGDLPCLPGLDTLGIGFDAVFGRKRVVTATEFTFALNKTWAHPVTGTVYAYPDQVSLFDDVSDVSTTVVITSEQEMSDYYANKFGLKIGVPGLFTFGIGTRSSTEVFYGAQSLLALVEEDITFLELVISTLEPSDALVQSVNKLPSKMNQVEYAQFVETYGTHFVEQSSYGGTTTMRTAVDQSYYNNYQESDVKVQANVMFGGFKVGGHVQVGQNTQDFQVYDTSSFAEFGVVGGQYDTYTMNSDSWSKWESSLYCDPAGVSQKVSSIVDLVSSIDKTKGNLLNDFITQYMTNAQKTFDKTALSLPSKAIPQYTFTIISDINLNCPNDTVLLGLDGYAKKHSSYYNLQPSHCAEFTWNEEALSSGLVGPVFVDQSSCVEATVTSSKQYSGCPPNMFAYGWSGYENAHGGVVGVSPILCCNMAYYPQTHSDI